MELKRILGRDSRSATAEAMEQFGRDALIISNERVNGKVEVIVAVELADGSACAVDDAARSAGAAFAPLVPEGSRRFGEMLQQSMGAISRPAAPAAGDDAPPARSLEKQEFERAQELVQMVREEFAELRREFRISRELGAWQASHGLAAAVEPLAAALVEAGVPAGLRGLLHDQLREADSFEGAVAALEGCLTQSMRAGRHRGLLEGIHVIAGPSGAGKSMMVGRLAAAHARADAHRPEGVAVVGFCDQRPGAWSQLQLLSAQAGVECYRANNAQMLGEIIGEIGCRRLVLIDTPGARVAEHVGRIAGTVAAAQFHLLLPADASAATFKRFLAPSNPAWQSLMLSKLDESSHPWPLVQVLCERDLTLSFAGRAPGVDVNESIEGPDAPALVRLALGSLGVQAPPAAAAPLVGEFMPNVWRSARNVLK